MYFIFIEVQPSGPEICQNNKLFPNYFNNSFKRDNLLPNVSKRVVSVSGHISLLIDYPF